MAIKKSELYSSLWASCDELRGGMDASQYKDYVLFMLFIKYISDKYADYDGFDPPVKIPEGASFTDMVSLKGSSDIGDKINKQIIQPLVNKNNSLASSDFPDFNDPNKLGEGKAMIDRLTNLISIFEKPELNFSKNRADHDDILGDAYEYLMRHFASESGKSKGQFYTPSEVSRVIAQVIGIATDDVTASTKAYDPACGSGSLLLKVAAEADKRITLEGQEKDVTTAGLARMNMILHDFPTASIMQGNTLSNPKFKDNEQLRTYDYVVANPPFSDKGWSSGLTPENDPYQRFRWGVPPPKQGDYAYLLHILRSLSSTGKGAVILPHGVLFRGHAEAKIRKKLVQHGYLKGIIGLPPNLFYGTGIPACILVMDKENATARKGVFMIDAAKGFIKDGNKNRLREQDIYRMVDTFNKQINVPRYARMVTFEEILDPKNDYNLNLPRYIDSSEPEDRHDIHAHLNGGIPERDLDDNASNSALGLGTYWKVFPALRRNLFRGNGYPGYAELTIKQDEVRAAILEHEEFDAFRKQVIKLFEDWKKRNTAVMKGFDAEGKPKKLISAVGKDLLETFKEAPLLDPYDVYQHLMDYWAQTLQDDAYEIAADGWVARPRRVLEEVKSGKKKGERKDTGWTCDLVPKPYIVARYFSEEQEQLVQLRAELEGVESKLQELLEEHGGEEGPLQHVSTKTDAEIAFGAALIAVWSEEDPRTHHRYDMLSNQADAHSAELRELAQSPHFSGLYNQKGKLTLKSIKERLSVAEGDEKSALKHYLDLDKKQKELAKTARKLFDKAEQTYLEKLNKKPHPEALADLQATVDYLDMLEEQTKLRAKIKEADAKLDQLAYNQYARLEVPEIKTLVVDDKWMPALETAVTDELERVSQTLTGRVRELSERYATPLPQLRKRVEERAKKVEEHLKKMGFAEL